MSFHHIEFRRYLSLGKVGVSLCFPDEHFTSQACQHIFLADQFNGRVIARLDYILDDTLDRQLSLPGRPNVVSIKKKPMTNGGDRLYLQMFARFTVALDFFEDSIQIRYPSHAPIRLLLDDVLQAALQPVLDRIGGFILHGACMVRSKHAIVFMGNSGAGKSTTAYNLTRFGFDCYADDAVLVTPEEHRLFVWPLSREFSLRPLSFRLFEQQGISLGAHKRDGEKYYFRQTAESLPGAELKHICFLEVSGEEKTSISELDDEQTLTILTRNKRHFSFMGRSESHKYACALAKQTPAPIIGRVGTHLNHQGGIFDALCQGRMLETTANCSPSCLPTRKEKMELIRRVWLQSDTQDLADILPLMGDYDPKVFALALSLFQTLPVAKLCPISSPVSMPEPTPATFAPWIDVHGWLKGCQTLLHESALAVLQQFAISWIRSAPLTYPFLKVLSLGAPDRLEIIETAWEKFIKKNSPDNKEKTIHIVAGQEKDWSAAQKLSKDYRLCIWVSVDHAGGGERLTEQVRAVAAYTRLTLIPILGKDHRLDKVVDLFRHLAQHGVAVKIHRNIPLCGLTEKNACYLLASDGFDYRSYDNPASDEVRLISTNNLAEVVHEGEGRDATTVPGFTHSEKPFETCRTCAMSPLGLCRGGFFNQP